jgi:hypothetical protein
MALSQRFGMALSQRFAMALTQRFGITLAQRTYASFILQKFQKSFDPWSTV